MDANNKYGIPEPYCYEINVFDEHSSQAEIDESVWRIFLMVTDHIPNKIIESLIENLADATTLNFITVFIQFVVDARIHYSDVLKLRKRAREEINRLGEATEPEPVVEEPITESIENTETMGSE